MRESDISPAKECQIYPSTLTVPVHKTIRLKFTIEYDTPECKGNEFHYTQDYEFFSHVWSKIEQATQHYWTVKKVTVERAYIGRHKE